MGQQVTKDIRSRLEHHTVNELLVNDEYLKKIEQTLPELPEKSFHNLTNVLAARRNAPPRDRSSKLSLSPPRKECQSSFDTRTFLGKGLITLGKIQPQDINISQEVGDTIKQDYRNLLRQASGCNFNVLTPCDHYEFTCKSQTNRLLGRILWRFLTTFYNDILSELDLVHRRGTTRESDGLAFIVAVICQTGKHDPSTVQERVLDWVRIGRRYRRFMNSLCSGCLFLLPEKVSDQVWERHAPVTGRRFDDIIKFLRDLGIIHKCDKEGWNDLSDEIFKTFREPFQSLIALPFGGKQQSQLCNRQATQLALACGDKFVRNEQSTLSHDQRGKIQDNGENNPPLCKIHDSRTTPKPNPSRVEKSKRKHGATAVWPHLRGSPRERTAHQKLPLEKSFPVVRQSHARLNMHIPETQPYEAGMQCQASRAGPQSRVSSSNHAEQWLLQTDQEANPLPLCPLRTEDPEREPIHNISLNINTNEIDQRRRVEGSEADSSRFERTSYIRISALLNSDENTSAENKCKDLTNNQFRRLASQRSLVPNLD